MSVAIQDRYAALAPTPSSLSCGRAATRIDAQPGQVCLDLGSGRGADVLALAGRVGPAGHAYGVDLTPAMVDHAKAQALKAGVDNVTFLQSAIERLPLATGLADWVTSNCVLNHVDDKPQAWREIARVLKPGGRFIVSDIYAVERIADRWRSDPQAVAECWGGAITRDEYLAAVHQAGLEEVTVLDEGAPREKGQARVASFTLAGRKPARPQPTGSGVHAKEVKIP